MQVIHEGFKNKESTPSCFMDFEKEYDSSGEEDGLIMKLSRLCVNGSMWKRELVTLLNLSSWCLVMVEQLFLAVPRGRLRFVIVVLPDHTHLLFWIFSFLSNRNVFCRVGDFSIAEFISHKCLPQGSVRVGRALQIISEVHCISKISTKKLIEFYVIFVSSIMQHGCSSVWQTI